MLRLVVVLMLLASAVAVAQPSPLSPTSFQRIVGAAAGGQARAWLERLTDRIGGRLTGSSESAAAATLILETLHAAGFQDAHTEEYALATGWRRGPATARIASPVSRSLVIGSYGWAPGTNGPIEAWLKTATMSRDGTLDVPPETLKGAAVLVTIDSGTNMYATSAIVLRARAIRLCADAGVTAMLIASDKPHRMLYTSAYAIYPRAPIPVLSVAREDALLLQRLLKTDPVRLVIDVRNDFVSGPLPERNVVAELPGSGREIVVLGAHYDSWDWGQGANDNGSGVAAVLDAARILRTLDTTPAATIRFVFFSGEEEGCLGSRAYVETHRAELDRHRALILMDGGAQAPIGFSVKGRHDLVAPLTPVLAPLEVLGAGRVLPDGEVASDDETFLAAGVAALELMTEPGEYDTNHHAISDTFDKVDPRSLAADTAALAGAALAIAQLDRAPASRLSVRETTEFLERTGLVEDVRLVYGPDWNPR